MKEKNSRAYLKWICFVIILTMMILSGLFIALPTLISSPWGQAQFLSFINKQIPGSLSANKIHMSWLGNQSIEGLQLKDPLGKPVLSIEKIAFDSSLLKLLTRGLESSNAQILSLNATIEETQPGWTNLHHSFGIERPNSAPHPTPVTISLKELQAYLHLTPSASEPITLQLHGKTQLDDILGQFAIDLACSGIDLAGCLKNKQEAINLDQTTVHFIANIQNFPVALLDQIIAVRNPKLAGMLQLALGDTLNLSVENSLKIKEQQADLALSIKSDKLNSTPLQLHLGKELTLVQPADVHLSLASTFIQQLIGNTQKLTLNRESELELQLNQFTVPIQFTDFQKETLAFSDAIKRSLIEASLTCHPLNISSSNFGTFDMRHFAMNVKGNPFSEMQYQASADLEYFNAKFLAKPATLNLTLNPVNINFSQLSQNDLSKFVFSGTVASEELSFNQKLAHHVAEITLKKLHIPWELDALSNKIRLNINGETLLGNDTAPGILKADLLIENWLANRQIDLKSAAINAKFQLQKIPTLLLRGFPKGRELSEFLGNTLDVTLNASVKGNNYLKGILNLEVNGEELYGHAALNIDKVVTLQNPAQPIQMQLTLTPKRFDLMRSLMINKALPLSLQEPAKMSFAIHSLSFPLHEILQPSEGQGHWLSKTGATIQFGLERLRLFDKQHQQKIAFENIVANVESATLTKKIRFKIAAQESHHSTTEDLTFVGTVENALTPNLKPDLNNCSIHLEAKSKQLPASLLCAVACLDSDKRNKIETLLGQHIDADIKVQLNQFSGPLQATLKGKNGHLYADAKLNQGLLTLNTPLEISIAVSPKLGKTILEEILPILSGVIGAENPVKISIDPNGFSVPLQPLDLANIRLGKATIELGKMHFSNEGQLGMVFDLLKPSAHERLTVWFTPIYLNMQNGVLKVNRMDMLMLNQYPIALWGNVDFAKQLIDMKLGLTGTALNNAMNLLNLEHHYMMQIPLKGKMGEASIDKTKAAARISALIAQHQGGAHGVLIGTFLEIAGGGLTEEQAPPPTTNPFPWGTEVYQAKKQQQSQQNAETAESSKKRKKSKKIEDQIEEGASTLIKNLFH